MAIYGQNYGQILAKFLAIILVTPTTLIYTYVHICPYNRYGHMWSNQVAHLHVQHGRGDSMGFPLGIRLGQEVP